MRTFSSDNPATIMEVCGTHTHELFRTGIRFALPNWVKLISGQVVLCVLLMIKT